MSYDKIESVFIGLLGDKYGGQSQVKPWTNTEVLLRAAYEDDNWELDIERGDWLKLYTELKVAKAIGRLDNFLTDSIEQATSVELFLKRLEEKISDWLVGDPQDDKPKQVTAGEAVALVKAYNSGKCKLEPTVYNWLLLVHLHERYHTYTVFNGLVFDIDGYYIGVYDSKSKVKRKIGMFPKDNDGMFVSTAFISDPLKVQMMGAVSDINSMHQSIRSKGE